MTGGQQGGPSPNPSALLSAALDLADPRADAPDVDAVAAALTEGLGCRAVAIYARHPSGAWSLAGGRDDDGVGPALTAFEAAHGEAAWAPEGQRLPDPDGPCYVLPAPPLGVVVLIEGASPLDASARHLAARVAAGLGRATAIERRRADAETASARATRLLDASTALLYEADPATLQVTYLSGAAERVLGVGSEAFESPGAWVDRIHPDDRAAALGGMDELFEQGRRRHEYRLRQADGTYRWILDDVLLVRDADGQPQRIVGASFDVEQRRRREVRLALVSRLQMIAVSLSTALLRAHKLEDPEAIIRSIAAIGEAVGANSVVVSRIEDGLVSVLHDWRAPGVEPLDEALLVIPEAQVEPFLGPMRGGEPLALDADQPMTPVQRAFLDGFGIDGVVAAPIVVRGRLAGILTTGLPASHVQIDDLVRPLQLMADAVGAGWQHQEDEQRLRQLNARLAHTNERQDALLTLSAALARAGDREALLEATRAQLLDILGLDAASLFEIMPDGRFTLTALDQPRPALAAAAPYIDAVAPPFDAGPIVVVDPPLLDGSAIVEAMRCGGTISTLGHAPDAFSDWRLLIEHDGLRCFAVVPLVTPTGAIGTLNIAHRAPGSMTEGELRWIEQIAAIIAAQLAIRRGQADLRELNASLEARVTERTAELRTTRDQLTAALAQADASVREKETLLQEVHHRVKNNLQIISSMLTLQIDQTQDPDARALLDASADRVRSMALIHQQLYSSVTLAQVDFGSYTERLARQLCASLAPDTVLKVSVAPVALPVDRAVPLGLVVNELVTNALKHGRGADGRCVLRLSVAQTETDLILTVADEGPGLPEGLPTLDGSSLGWTLVHALVRQVRGELEIVDGEGAVFRLRVPLGTTDD